MSASNVKTQKQYLPTCLRRAYPERVNRDDSGRLDPSHERFYPFQNSLASILKVNPILVGKMVS